MEYGATALGTDGPDKTRDAPLPANGQPAMKNAINAPAGIPILKPIALKGLSFLRPRSTPPTPRDVMGFVSRQDQQPDVVVDDEKAPFDPDKSTLSAPPLMEQFQDPSALADRANNRPSGILLNELPLLVALPQTPLHGETKPGHPTKPSTAPPAPTKVASNAAGSISRETTPIPAHAPSITKVGQSVTLAIPHQHHSGSRSNSPAPSLEAILLDRKRRLAATAATVSTLTSANNGISLGGAGAAAVPAVNSMGPSPTADGAVVAPRAAPPAKGTRFKSSPLALGGQNNLGQTGGGAGGTTSKRFSLPDGKVELGTTVGSSSEASNVVEVEGEKHDAVSKEAAN